MEDLKAKLMELKELLQQGLIDEGTYREEMKARLAASRAADGTRPTGGGAGEARGTALGFGEGQEIGPGPERQFRLVRWLGKGAMGEVWLAEDLAESGLSGEQTYVALKTLSPFMATGSRHREGLKREAINAKKLSHPNIIRIHDWYEDQGTKIPFLVMEYVEGRTLDEVLGEKEKLEYSQVMEMLEPLGEALAYAWEEHRIVHRDLKPENIYVTEGGKVKLLDFGISAQARDTATSMGKAGHDSSGTPGYAPPEAETRHKADARFDIYGLGVLAYELLEGELPYPQRRTAGTKWPDRPEGLNERQWKVLKKALAYEVSERTPEVREFLEGLRRAEGTVEKEQASESQNQSDKSSGGANSASKPAEAEGNWINQDKAWLKGGLAQDSTDAEDHLQERLREEHERAKRQAEDDLWEKTVRAGTLQDYKRYLEISSLTTYRRAALEKIEELESRGRDRVDRALEERTESQVQGPDKSIGDDSKSDSRKWIIDLDAQMFYSALAPKAFLDFSLLKLVPRREIRFRNMRIPLDSVSIKGEGRLEDKLDILDTRYERNLN